MPPSQDITSPVVKIPEILEIIFSHLNQYTLWHHVQLVSREWNAVCSPLLDITANCIFHEQPDSVLRVKSTNQSTQAAEKLARANCLHISFKYRHWPRTSHIPFFAVYPAAMPWEDAMAVIGPQNQQGGSHGRLLRKLVIGGEYTANPMMPSLVQLLSHHPLTDVRIDYIYREFCYLGEILELLPSLQRFHAVSKYETTLRNRSEASGPLQKRSSVQELTLDNLIVNQITLEDILERHGQCLQRLSIVSAGRIQHDAQWGPLFQRVDIFDRRSFLHAVHRSCPQLKALHFSLRFPNMDKDSLETIREAFPALTDLSIPNSDLHGHDHPQIRAYLQQLTRLELTKAVLPAEAMARFLHEFLCDAPNLLHLVAPECEYRTVYLDVQEQHMIPTMAMPFKGRFWACKKLRTLALGFDESSSLGIFTRAGASRLVFGYLAKACPQLQDLSLRRRTLCWDFESGMCLLSRLNKLQRLEIRSEWATSIKDVDLGWMGVGRAIEAMGDQNDEADGYLKGFCGPVWNTLVQEQVTALRVQAEGGKNLDLYLQEGCEELAEPDFAEMGRLQDVQNRQRELASIEALHQVQGSMVEMVYGRMDSNPVLPNLAFLGFRVPLCEPIVKGQDSVLANLIRKYRPALQIETDYQST
ncbi:hypothetical protein MVEG_10345 [Podila verticillata NRRL 6337]|nr:hypothetical protein MVEG_10345 [Podila verticillata NRRL 6337]